METTIGTDIQGTVQTCGRDIVFSEFNTVFGHVSGELQGYFHIFVCTLAVHKYCMVCLVKNYPTTTCDFPPTNVICHTEHHPQRWKSFSRKH